MRARRGIVATICAAALAGCAQPLARPPATPPDLGPVQTDRWFMGRDGLARAELDPYAPAPARRADIDAHVSLIAPDVALAVSRARGAPVYVSNLLGSALARRFSGALDQRDALRASQLFLIEPVVSSDAATTDGRLIVDWRVKTGQGVDIGAVYVERRLTGAISDGDVWSAFTRDDAEHIALQAAAAMWEDPEIRGAVALAIAKSRLQATPDPVEKPEPPEKPEPAPPPLPLPLPPQAAEDLADS